jgi:hypothetical protein
MFTVAPEELVYYVIVVLLESRSRKPQVGSQVSLIEAEL